MDSAEVSLFALVVLKFYYRVHNTKWNKNHHYSNSANGKMKDIVRINFQ